MVERLSVWMDRHWLWSIVLSWSLLGGLAWSCRWWIPWLGNGLAGFVADFVETMNAAMEEDGG